MQVPRPTMDKDLQAEEKSLTEDINSLTKKVTVFASSACFSQTKCLVQSKYLEKQFNDAQAQLRDIVSVLPA
jgi:prefoldin subunit 1